ncbi:hypothetical protein [Nocardia thailandica]
MSGFLSDPRHPLSCARRTGRPYCTPEALDAALVQLAVTVARRLRRQRFDTDNSYPAGPLAVDHRAVRRAPDPRFEFQFDRCLMLLARAAQCPRHFAADCAAAAAETSRSAVRTRAVPPRLRDAMLAYLAADRAHRETAAKDVVFRLDLAVKDFARSFLAATPFTSRPERKLAGLRDVDGHPLLTAEQVRVVLYLVRGVAFGEPIAAGITVGDITGRSAAEYLRRVAEAGYRSGISGAASPFTGYADDQLLAGVAAVGSPELWSRGSVDRTGECLAEVLFDTWSSWAHELRAVSLDAHLEHRGIDIADDREPADSPATDLAVLRDLRSRGYIRADGHPLSARQRRMIDDRIAELAASRT